MPRGDKDKYTEKQKRQAEHIEEGYEKRGVPEDEADGLVEDVVLTRHATGVGRLRGVEEVSGRLHHRKVTFTQQVYRAECEKLMDAALAKDPVEPDWNAVQVRVEQGPWSDATLAVNRPAKPTPRTSRIIVTRRPATVLGGSPRPLNRSTQTLQRESPQVAKSGLSPPSARWIAPAPISQLRRIAATIRPAW